MVVLLVGCNLALAEESERGQVSLYGGVLTDNNLGELFQGKLDREPSCRLVALTYGEKIGSYRRLLDFGVEGQLVQHFGDQDHQEINALLVFRWRPFPWDRFLDTSTSVGMGLSLATEVPELEERRDEGSSQLLGYLMFELAFSLPKYPQWELFGRIHHRSGAGNYFTNIQGSSNAVGFGIRYSYKVGGF
jgi:hypothetical protein